MIKTLVKGLMVKVVLTKVLEVLARVLLVLTSFGCIGKGFVCLKQALGDVGKSFVIFEKILGGLVRVLIFLVSVEVFLKRV